MSTQPEADDPVATILRLLAVLQAAAEELEGIGVGLEERE
jgi:hypothetical protein